MITWMRCAGLAWLAMVIGLALGCASPHGPKVSGRHQQPVSDVPPPDSPEVTDADPPTILPETHMSAGRLHESQNQFLRAAEQYQLAIKLKPDHVAAYNRLGIVLDRLGRYEKADETFRRAIQLAPDQAYLHNNLAFSCILQSHWTEAEIELTRALELQPNFARARVNLAMVLAQQSRFEEALNQFQTALSAAEAYYNIGLMYQSKRKPVEAAQAFAQALELNPKLVAAGKRLEQLPADVVSAAHQRGSLNFHTAQTASPAPSEPIEPGQARPAKAQPTTGPSPTAQAPYVSNALETTKSLSPDPCETGFPPVDFEGLGIGSEPPPVSAGGLPREPDATPRPVMTATAPAAEAADAPVDDQPAVPEHLKLLIETDGETNAFDAAPPWLPLVDPQSALTDPGWPRLEDSRGGSVPDLDGPAPSRLKAALLQRVRRVATRFRWLTGTLQQLAARLASEAYAMSAFASPASPSPPPSAQPSERLQGTLASDMLTP